MALLHRHLGRRVRSAYRSLERSLEGLAPPDWERGVRDGWRRYRFGVGLDGSIAGIIRHVGVWKHVFAAGMETGRFPDAEGLAAEVADAGEAELLAWLANGQQRLIDQLATLADADLEREVVVEGQRMPLHECFSHLIEHDQYHAGQINLLRQQWGHDLS